MESGLFDGAVVGALFRTGDDGLNFLVDFFQQVPYFLGGRGKVHKRGRPHAGDTDFAVLTIHIDLAGQAKTQFAVSVQYFARIGRIAELDNLKRRPFKPLIDEGFLYIVHMKNAHARLTDLVLHALHGTIKIFVRGYGVVKFHMNELGLGITHQ